MQRARLGICSASDHPGAGLHRVLPKHGPRVCSRGLRTTCPMVAVGGKCGMRLVLVMSSTSSEVESRTETFLKELEKEGEEGEDDEVLEMQSAIDDLEKEVIVSVRLNEWCNHTPDCKQQAFHTVHGSTLIQQ